MLATEALKKIKKKGKNIFIPVSTFMGKNADGKNSNNETKWIYLYYITTEEGAMS